MKSKQALSITFFTVFLIIIFLVSCALSDKPYGNGGVSDRDWANLQFREDGKFEIMIIADIQIGNRGLDIGTRRFLHAALDHPDNANLDLIVLLGDNLASDVNLRGGGYADAIRSYMDIFWHFQIPVAIVFGNHEWLASAPVGGDTEGPGDLMPQLRVFQEYPNALIWVQDPEYTEYRDGDEFFIAEADRDGRGTKSIGNFNIPIKSSCGSNPLAYNMWFFYTGSSTAAMGGFDGVRDAALNWYDWKSERLQRQNNGNLVPSIVFQHVPVRKVTSATVIENNFTDNTPPNEFTFRQSGHNGWPVPAGRYRGQYLRHQQRGDVEAMFFGHEHTHHFKYTPAPSNGFAGIPLIYTGRSALCRDHTSIGPFAVTRVITIHEDRINQEGVSFTTRTFAANGTQRVPDGAWGNLQPAMSALTNADMNIPRFSLRETAAKPNGTKAF